jgi:hypothetical protein
MDTRGERHGRAVAKGSTLSVITPRRSRRQGDRLDGAGIATDRGEEGFQQALRGELERGRRYCRPFALVRVPLGEPAANGRRPWNRRRQPVAEDLIRSTDTAWTSDGALYLLLPESDRTSAEQCVKRLGATVDLVASAAATVVFPDDGVTTGGLLGALTKGPDPSALGQWAGTWQQRSDESGRSEVS